MECESGEVKVIKQKCINQRVLCTFNFVELAPARFVRKYIYAHLLFLGFYNADRSQPKRHPIKLLLYQIPLRPSDTSPKTGEEYAVTQ